MRVDTCADMWGTMGVDMCANMYVVMCLCRGVDTRADMCVDLCGDMCV